MFPLFGPHIIFVGRSAEGKICVLGGSERELISGVVVGALALEVLSAEIGFLPRVLVASGGHSCPFPSSRELVTASLGCCPRSVFASSTLRRVLLLVLHVSFLSSALLTPVLSDLSKLSPPDHYSKEEVHTSCDGSTQEGSLGE